MLLTAMLVFGLISIILVAVQFLAYFHSIKPKKLGYSAQRRLNAAKELETLRTIS